MESLITTIITLIILFLMLAGMVFIGLIIFVNFVLYAQEEDKK
jgi:hypothetical protein